MYYGRTEHFKDLERKLSPMDRDVKFFILYIVKAPSGPVTLGILSAFSVQLVHIECSTQIISNEPIQHTSVQGRKVQVMVAAFNHHIYFGLKVLGQIISAVDGPSLVLITYHLP